MAAYKLTVEIPYECRSTYSDTVYQINRAVELDGLVLLAVKNDIDALEALLIVETDAYQDEVIRLAKKVKLFIRDGEGLQDIVEGASYERYDYTSFPPGITRKHCDGLYLNSFLFPEPVDDDEIAEESGNEIIGTEKIV